MRNCFSLKISKIQTEKFKKVFALYRLQVLQQQKMLSDSLHKTVPEEQLQELEIVPVFPTVRILRA